MKTNILTNMKEFAKYICTVVMLLGMSVSAWGTHNCDLMVWDKSQSKYVKWKTISDGYVFGKEWEYPWCLATNAYDYEWYSYVIAWTPSTYDAGYPSNKNYYYKDQIYGKEVDGVAYYPTTLYAVYDEDGYYSDYVSNPDYQLYIPKYMVVYDLTGLTLTSGPRGIENTSTSSFSAEFSFDTGYEGPVSGTVSIGGWDYTVTWDKYNGITYGDADFTGTTFRYGAGLIDDDVYVTLVATEESCTTNSVVVVDGETETSTTGNYGTLTSVALEVAQSGSGAITWTSSNTNVATVSGDEDDATVTIVGAGTATITASSAADATYCAGEATYSITVNAIVPTVTAFTGTSSSPTSITLTNAQVSNKGGAAISAYGYIYSTTASTTETLKLGETGVSTATVASADIAASTNFASKTVSELTTGTTYYVRAYATNSAGTGYSAIQSVKTIAYTDYKFSCADWTLTGPSGDIVFITSAANKTVCSQEAFHVSGNGLPHETALTFTTFPVNEKFEFKKADGSAISTDEYGVVDADVYVFYTPGVGDTSDGLDEITSLTVSVTGEPRTATIATKRVIGRHLPADFVIAAKKDGKWWVMPSNMSSTTNPTPVEISVDNATNPSIAYTLSNTYYGLAGPTAANISGGNGQYIRFAMSIDDGTLDPHAAPLFGIATGKTTLGKSGTSQISSDLNAGYWWKLVQTNTSITNPQDAKYTIYCANNTQSLTLEDGGLWGLYATNGTDVDELRLVPARSGVSYEEAEIVEWGQHGAIVEVDTHLGYHTKVKAKLNGAETGFITLSQTKTSVSKVDTKYNYTVNFGDGIDFAAAASNGAMLTLEWYNTSEVLQSVSNITVPKIIASSATMSSIESGDTPWSKWEVHVLPGVTLDANAGSFSSSDVVINNLQLYPGAILKVTTGTLDVTNLSLRNGWRRVGVAEPVYAAPRIQIKTTANLRHTNAYLDWYIDNDQFYPVAVPFPVKVSTITYLNTKNSVTVGGTSGVIRLRYFDGENRAAGNSGNWKYYGAVGCTAVPDTLKPSMGYALAAMRPGGKAFSILRMPLIYTDEWTALGEQASVVIETKTYHKDTVHVYAYGTGQTAEWNKGWNLIGNPYMSVFNGNDDGISGKLLYVTNVDDPKKDKVRYVTIPNSSFTDYSQVNITEANIRPFSSFLIQAKDTSAISFSKSKIEIPSAPTHYTATPASLPEQEVYIRLSNEEASDQMGLIIGEDYTAEYETDADLAKMHGELNTLKTYMVYDNVDMAYVAINEQLAQEWIPVTVRIPESGQYTFSMRSISVVDELEGVYLIDYSNGQVTNLIENDYSFITSSGTISGRFAINAIIGERQTPTDIDIIQGGGDINSEQPVKFLYHDKVFIYHRGVIYDATGKKVREINK